jgi:hypothetical protein
MDEGGSRNGPSLSLSLSLSLKRHRGGDLGEGASSLGTLEDMLRKALGTDISLHGGPFPVEKNLESGGGSYTGDFEG